MFKSCLAGLALALALGGAQAEVTARHAYVSFDTVAAAQKNARADELVYFRATSRPSLRTAFTSSKTARATCASRFRTRPARASL